MATISEALAIGVAHFEAGRSAAAEEVFRRILAVEPDQPDAWHLLGLVRNQVGDNATALEHIRRAQVLKPGWPEAHYNLGNVLREIGQLDEAAAAYRQALALRPDFAQAYSNLAIIFVRQGKPDEVVACCRRALELQPDIAETHNNLGNALKDLGKPDEAIASYRRALELRPNFAVANNNLGNVLRNQGKLTEAIRCYRRALEVRPNYAEAHNNLGNAWKEYGDQDAALAAYRRALELAPDAADTFSNLLLTLQYDVRATPASLATAHAEFERRFAAPLRSTWRPHENVRDPHRRLRLGFASPDLARHPVGYFLVRALEHLDPADWEKVCYNDRIDGDDLTARVRAAAAVWHDTYSWSDEQLAAKVREDRIDILFDMAGHTRKNRLMALARKPAPLQVTWLGYEGTTGMAAMDYLLADRHMIPDGAERHYRERVLRMPDGYVCYDPHPAAPPVGPLPATKPGRVTFGSCNNPLKITPVVVKTWSAILRRLPESRLVMKYQGLGEPDLQTRFRRSFAACGVDGEQLSFLPHTSYTDYLAEYGKIDLALDPFPFSGGATTCEALWMGVPVLTCPGETFASRHGLSHLSSIGLTETVAGDLNDYVERAVALAGDLQRLAALRAGLRPQMAASALCDGKRFAANLSALLREIWQRWVADRRQTGS